MILTNFLWNNAHVTSHTLLSPKVPYAQKEWVLHTLKSAGANSINLYLLNQGDYGGEIVCPYRKDRWFSPELDLERLAQWDDAVRCCVAMGLHPIFWLAADDSPVIKDAWKNKRQDVANIYMYLARRFDQYALAWCIGLECNEWANRELTEFYGSIVAASVQHPVGVHQTSGRWDYAKAPCFYFAMLQYGFGSKNHTAKASDVAAMTRKCIRETGKPVIACEYSRYGDSKEAKAAGQAAIEAGAVGVCNGF